MQTQCPSGWPLESAQHLCLARRIFDSLSRYPGQSSPSTNKVALTARVLQWVTCMPADQNCSSQGWPFHRLPEESQRLYSPKRFSRLHPYEECPKPGPRLGHPQSPEHFPPCPPFCPLPPFGLHHFARHLGSFSWSLCLRSLQEPSS